MASRRLRVLRFGPCGDQTVGRRTSVAIRDSHVLLGRDLHASPLSRCRSVGVRTSASHLDTPVAVSRRECSRLWHLVGGGEHSTDVWRALHFGSGVRDVLLSRLQSALELPLDLAKTGFDHKIRNEPRAEQGATANAHVRHASCWRRSRAGQARG